MDLIERYDELDNIESTLRILIDEITDKDYISQLQEIMYQAENEKAEVEDDLEKENEQEINEMNYQYERNVIQWK